MTTVPPPDHKDETVLAHLGRSCKNAVTKCFGAVQTTDEYAKIKYKEYQLETRKKAFGVAYLNLVRDRSSGEDAANNEQALKACVDAALADCAGYDKEIEVLQTEIDRVNHTTKEKILKPGGGGNAKPTTPTTAAAAAAASAPTAPPTPAAAAPAPAAPAPTPAAAPPAQESTKVLASGGVSAEEDGGMQEVALDAAAVKQ